MSNPQDFPLPGSPKDSQKYKPLFRIILGASVLALLAAAVLFLNYDSGIQKPEPVSGGFGSTPTLVSPTDVALEMTTQNQPEVVISTPTLIPTEVPSPTVTPTELPILTEKQIATFGVDLQAVSDSSQQFIDGDRLFLYNTEFPGYGNEALMNKVRDFFLSLSQGRVPNLKGLKYPLYMKCSGDTGLDIPQTTLSREVIESLKAQGASIIYMMPIVEDARPEISILSPTAHFLDPKDRFDKWNVPDKFATLVLGADVSKEISDATGEVFGGVREVGISEDDIDLWANPQVIIIVPPGVDLSKFLGNYVFGRNTMPKEFMVESGIVVVEFVD